MEQKWQERQTNSWWEQRADTNKDGHVDTGELSAWKELQKEHIDLNNDGVIDAKEKRLCWLHARSRVNTELEQKFDENNDGWLDPEEARKLLFRRVDAIFASNGKSPIKSALEEAYDTNNDGVIDLEELKTLREDLK